MVGQLLSLYMRYLLLALILVVAACDQGQKVAPFAERETTAYMLCKTPTLKDGVQMRAQLDTSKQEQLQLKILIRNTSGSPLEVHPLEAALHTQDERRQQPLNISAEAKSIPAGEEKVYTLLYQPVNDLFLYQRSGLQGPWLQEYRLPLSFISGLRDTLSFCFPEEDYLKYMAAAALKKPVLYKPTHETTAPEAARRQEAYLRGIVGIGQNAEAGSAYFSEQEFFSGGINVRHALFQRGDSVYLQLQLINHAPYVLELIPAKVAVSYRGEAYSPVRITGNASSNKDSYHVRKGERQALTLVYKAPAADSLIVSLAGVQLVESKKPLFQEDFNFVRE